jgi:hypothetical protein
MVSGENRTYGFAGSFATLLTKYGHETRFDVGIFTLPIAFDVDPMHPAPISRFGFPNNRHVVLRMAGDYTCLATGTSIQVYHHSPATIAA